MLRHTFALNLVQSQRIRITQARAGAEARVFYQQRRFGQRTRQHLLGVAAPADLLSGYELALEDGSTIKVQVVENQMQVWRQGWKLDEVRPSRRSWMPGLIIFFCIFALLFDIGCLWLLWDAQTQHSFGAALLFLLLLLAAPFIAIIPDLLSLAHAIATHSWGWVSYGLGPLTLLGIGAIGFVLFQRSHLSNAFVSPLTVLLVVSPLVIPPVCLIYALVSDG